MLRDITRRALQGVQFLGAKFGNRGNEKPAPMSKAHDLLKARWMANYIEDGARILDVGCGNGHRLMDLSLFIRELEGYGVDVREKQPPKVAVPGVKVPTLQVYDGESIPFEDKHFDVSMICYVLHHLQEPHARSVLAEMVRVTRGKLLLLEDSRPEFSLAYRLRNWAHATEANLGYAQESTYFKQNFQHTMFKTHGEWAQFLETIEGIEHVTCVPLTSISKYAHHTLFVAELAG